MPTLASIKFSEIGALFESLGATIEEGAGSRVSFLLDAETNMSKKTKAAVSHHARKVEELRADRGLAVEYLKSAGGVGYGNYCDADPLIRY